MWCYRASLTNSAQCFRTKILRFFCRHRVNQLNKVGTMKRSSLYFKIFKLRAISLDGGNVDCWYVAFREQRVSIWRCARCGEHLIASRCIPIRFVMLATPVLHRVTSLTHLYYSAATEIVLSSRQESKTL